MVLKDFIFWLRKFLKLYTNNIDFVSFRWMFRWCRQYSSKLPVCLSHSHTFHGWCRSVCVGYIRRTVLNVYTCLNHSSRYKHNKLEKRHEKQRHQKAVFSKFRKFSFFSWTVKVPYLQLLLNILHQSFTVIVTKIVIFTIF